MAKEISGGIQCMITELPCRAYAKGTVILTVLYRSIPSSQPLHRWLTSTALWSSPEPTMALGQTA